MHALRACGANGGLHHGRMRDSRPGCIANWNLRAGSVTITSHSGLNRRQFSSLDSANRNTAPGFDYGSGLASHTAQSPSTPAYLNRSPPLEESRPRCLLDVKRQTHIPHRDPVICFQSHISHLVCVPHPYSLAKPWCFLIMSIELPSPSSSDSMLAPHLVISCDIRDFRTFVSDDGVHGDRRGIGSSVEAAMLLEFVPRDKHALDSIARWLQSSVA